ncbi:transposase [Nocardia sp. NPDC059246]|uniref:transposase n=1 Tax=unclassified Nocardia TaxID=2637762 RepID=UPI00367B34A1
MSIFRTVNLSAWQRRRQTGWGRVFFGHLALLPPETTKAGPGRGNPEGRPWTRPRRVLADMSYSTRAIREHLRGRGIAATIPERIDQQANRRRRGRNGSRPPVFDPIAYRRRNVVERCFNRLEQYRAIATRYDKTATSYRGMLDLATLLIWL